MTLDAAAVADLGSMSRADATALLLQLSALQTRLVLALTMAGNPETSHASAPELLDAAQLAARLGVAESWIRRAQRSGKIPCIKVGRYRRFDPAAVAAALGAKP